MGYRSNVVLCVKKSKFKKLQVIGKPFPELFRDHFEESLRSTDEELLYFVAEGLKMYTSCPDIKEFYDWMENTLLNKNFHYIEAGEASGDVMVMGELYRIVDTRLYAQTVITYPGGNI